MVLKDYSFSANLLTILGTPKLAGTNDIFVGENDATMTCLQGYFY